MELELSEVETQPRRMENKRKRVEEPSKPEERKEKKVCQTGELGRDILQPGGSRSS